MIEPGVEAAVRAAERALYDAMVTRDFDALGRLLAPDLVYVHSTAVSESRDRYLAGVAQGLYEYTSIESRDVRFRGNDRIVLEDGVCDMQVGAKGGPAMLIHLIFVLVWTKSEAGWQLLHRHATRRVDTGRRTTTESER
jgi:ketosteroid isomerase-like protein